MMIRKAYLTLILLATLVGAGAQTNDPEAKAILDAVSAKFQTFKTVKAGFTYKVESAAGKVLSSKTGSIMMKGTKYMVNFGGQEIYCNGTTIWSYDPAAKEVTINKLDASSGMITPQKLFTNFYDKDFLYVLNGEKKNGAKVIQEIEMTPVDKTKTFHKVYVQIDKKAKTIYSTKVLENAGNRYSYTISSLKTNLPMTDDQFVFNKATHPGVEEVDLR